MTLQESIVIFSVTFYGQYKSVTIFKYCETVIICILMTLFSLINYIRDAFTSRYLNFSQLYVFQFVTLYLVTICHFATLYYVIVCNLPHFFKFVRALFCAIYEYPSSFLWHLSSSLFVTSLLESCDRFFSTYYKPCNIEALFKH